MKSLQKLGNDEAFVKDLVLTSMADDYENLECIAPTVIRWGNIRGAQLGRDEVIKALQAVVSEGHAQCYELSPHPPHVTPVAFDPQRVDELYFYVTPAGKDIVKNVEELGVDE
jgi:hypothetical protein